MKRQNSLATNPAPQILVIRGKPHVATGDTVLSETERAREKNDEPAAAGAARNNAAHFALHAPKPELQARIVAGAAGAATVPKL